MRKLYTILCVLALTGCSGFLEEYSQDKAYVKGWEDLDELMLGNAYFNPVYYSKWLVGARKQTGYSITLDSCIGG